MGFGVFFICVIMLVFTVTHMLKFDSQCASVDMAAELGLILLGGLCLYLALYFVRAVV
jgi:hypothetical protein